MFPTLAGSVVLGYNIPFLTKDGPFLNLTRPVIVGIFDGNITSWNDPGILSTNPFLAIILRNYSSSPNITSVKRFDSSGTTQIFSSALASFDPIFKSSFGTFQANLWPKPRAPGVSVVGDGNPGVAVKILTNTWSIGYLEKAVADQYLMPSASIINRAGNIVAPSVKGIRSAIADFSSVIAKVNLKVFSVNIVDGPSRYLLIRLH